MTGKLGVYGDSISGNCYKVKLLCSGPYAGIRAWIKRIMSRPNYKAMYD